MVDFNQVTSKKRIEILEEKIGFLLAENIRLNQVIRELIFYNDLVRSDSNTQTKESFDYQWKHIPDGKWMPSNKKYLKSTKTATAFLEEMELD